MVRGGWKVTLGLTFHQGAGESETASNEALEVGDVHACVSICWLLSKWMSGLKCEGQMSDLRKAMTSRAGSGITGIYDQQQTSLRHSI